MKRFLTLSALASLVLVAFAGLAPVASAHCTVNVGTCAGHCTVNVGYCGPYGSCTVNVGACFSAVTIICRALSGNCDIDIIHANPAFVEPVVQAIA